MALVCSLYATFECFILLYERFKCSDVNVLWGTLTVLFVDESHWVCQPGNEKVNLFYRSFSI